MKYFLSLLFGLGFGSFANVCILRLPKDESLWRPRSHCPHCGHKLRNIHNIPLLSFLALQGRCYDCQARISCQYPLVEALLAILFLFHTWYFSGSLKHMIVADILSFYLLTISLIDYRYRIIPDELSLSLLAIGLGYSFINPYLPGPVWLKFCHSLGASVGGGLLMMAMAYAGEKAFKKEALGGGDIKLIAASAAILGWTGIMSPLLLGSLSGGLMAIGLIFLKKKKFGETLPFGPFLSIGTYMACLFPNWWIFFFRL